VLRDRHRTTWIAKPFPSHSLRAASVGAFANLGQASTSFRALVATVGQLLFEDYQYLFAQFIGIAILQALEF